MAPSHHPLMESSKVSERMRAVEKAENQILKIIEALEKSQNISVDEVIGNGPDFTDYQRVVICWHLNNREV